MQENHQRPEQDKDLCERQQESKKYLIFYVIGLFCVALALILLSYVSQVRADRRLNELSSQLTSQTSAVEGANARVQVLQQSVEEQRKLIASQQKTLDTLYQMTDTDSTEAMLDAVKQLTAQKQALYALTMVQSEWAQGKKAEAKARMDAMVKTYGLDALNGTGKHPLLTAECAALFTSLYQTVQAP